MKYSDRVIAEATAILNQKRLASKRKNEETRLSVYEHCPELKYIDDALANTGIEISKAILTLKDSNLGAKIDELKNKNQDLLKERQYLLHKIGLKHDYLDNEFFCKKCEDTGYKNGKMCTCLEKTLKDLSYKELCNSTPLALTGYDFDNFSLDYYPKISDGQISPFDIMSQILSYCKNYCNGFSEKSSSILMEGKTGLGKTHLSVSIAKAVISRGYGVIYTTAQELFSACEREHFGRGDNNTNALQNYCSCDLLIIDDLGSELTTNFTVSVLYNIVNQRILYNKPTIISTNLSIREITNKYNDKISSRLMGYYKHLGFEGKDIRLMIMK